MNENRTKKQEQGRCWVGIDWGGQGHSVCVVNDKRGIVSRFKTGASLTELERLVERLRGFGEIGGIAIESTRDPVVIYLSRAGYTVYLINPKISKQWRACNCVADVKSDERDGLVLAVELARRHETLHPFKEGNPLAAELRGLCEKERELIEQRTALLQRLKALLGQYYRGVLDFFSDWSSPVAWRFIKRFPRPDALARAKKETLIAFLKANRIGLKPIWLERIEARGEMTRWPKPGNSISLELTVMAITAELQALQPTIDKFDKLIAECAEKLPHTHLMQSLPGAGKRLAPALAAITADVACGQRDIQGLRCMTGVAPVEEQSGKRRRVHIRSRCNKHQRNIMHMFANCSLLYCAWAKAFYDMHKEQGDRHATALRKLADKWLKIIMRMLQTGEPYDDDHYVQALRKSRSPIYSRLCGNTCG